MAGPIALVGGDEFLPGCEAMDREILLSISGSAPRVLVVPTAAAQQGPAMAANNGVTYFEGLGAEALPLMVLDDEDAEDIDLVDVVGDADVIYFTGGSPGYLMDVLQGSMLLEKVLAAQRMGAVLAGSSAGAMVLGGWMGFGDLSAALGVVEDVMIMPHHERSDPAQVSKELASMSLDETFVLGIDAKSACFGGPDGWKALGDGAVTVYSQGAWSRYGHGDDVELG